MSQIFRSARWEVGKCCGFNLSRAGGWDFIQQDISHIESRQEAEQEEEKERGGKRGGEEEEEEEREEEEEEEEKNEEEEKE